MIMTASSGVAANNLSGGRTAHSAYGIPVAELTPDTTCSIMKRTTRADHVIAADLHVWDEISMADRYAIEAVDKLLQVNLSTNQYSK